MKQSKSALCVLLAGTLWGSMGLFVRKLNAVGLYALDIVQLRIAISLVLVGLYLLIFARVMQKLLALVLTFTGCCLVSGLGSGSAVSMKGLLLGLGSGFFYALYSIFSRYAIERGYGSWTITFYTFLLCLLASAPLAHWGLIASALSSGVSVPVYALLMGLLTGFRA